MVKKEQSRTTTEELQLWKVMGVFALVFTGMQLAAAAVNLGTNYLIELINVEDNLRVFFGSTISSVGIIAATILITAPVIRAVFGKPGAQSLYPRVKNWWKDLLIGMGISSAAMLVLFLIEFALGWISVTGFVLDGSALDAWLRTIWVALLFGLTVSIKEEVLFHGLLMQGVNKAWDMGGALLISSIIIGGYKIFDIGITNSNWLQFIPLLALPGLVFGWAYFRTGNLWLATGLHFAWSLFQDNILNLSGSSGGDTFFGLTTNVSGPKWFIGTSHGIEVGAAGVLCCILVAVGIWRWTAKTRGAKSS